MTSLTPPHSPHSARPTRMPSWPLADGSKIRPRSVRRSPPSAAGPSARTNTSPCCTIRTTSCSRSNLERLSRVGLVDWVLAASAAATARAVLHPHRSHRPYRPYRGPLHHYPTSDECARSRCDFPPMARLVSRDQNRSGARPREEKEHCQSPTPPRRRRQLVLLAHSWYHRYASRR